MTAQAAARAATANALWPEHDPLSPFNAFLPAKRRHAAPTRHTGRRTRRMTVVGSAPARPRPCGPAQQKPRVRRRHSAPGTRPISTCPQHRPAVRSGSRRGRGPAARSPRRPPPRRLRARAQRPDRAQRTAPTSGGRCSSCISLRATVSMAARGSASAACSRPNTQASIALPSGAGRRTPPTRSATPPRWTSPPRQSPPSPATAISGRARFSAAPASGKPPPGPPARRHSHPVAPHPVAPHPVAPRSAANRLRAAWPRYAATTCGSTSSVSRRNCVIASPVVASRNVILWQPLPMNRRSAAMQCAAGPYTPQARSRAGE
jgi:hypothetical protein